MTGLDPEKNVLLEIATIITNYDLEIVDRGPVLAIHQSEARLKAMDAWNQRTHRESGLLDRVRKEGVSVAGAERETLKFVKRYCYKRTAPLCGNSIGQDKRFLAKYMPTLHGTTRPAYHSLIRTLMELTSTTHVPRIEADHASSNRQLSCTFNRCLHKCRSPLV